MNVTIGGENGQCTVEKVGNEYLVAFGVCFGLMQVVQPQMGVVEDDVMELGGWKPVKQGCGVDVVQDCWASKSTGFVSTAVLADGSRLRPAIL